MPDMAMVDDLMVRINDAVTSSGEGTDERVKAALAALAMNTAALWMVANDIPHCKEIALQVSVAIFEALGQWTEAFHGRN